MDCEEFILSLKPEQITQINILNWLSKFNPLARKLIIKIGNEGKHTISGHRVNSRMGLHKAASDLLLPMKNKNYCGLFIEIKKDGWECSGKKEAKHVNEQLEFIELMKGQGYWGEMIVGFDNGVYCIKNY